MEAMEKDLQGTAPEPQHSLLTFVVETALTIGRGRLLREADSLCPYLPQSTINGAFRARARQKIAAGKTAFTTEIAEGLFGREGAGSVRFTDATLLLLPARSTSGIFVWLSCPRSLGVFRAALRRAGFTNEWGELGVERAQALVGSPRGEALIEEFSLRFVVSAEVAAAARAVAEHVPFDDWLREKLLNDLVVVHDEDFSALSALCVEMIEVAEIDEQARVTGARGVSFIECVPAEAVFFAEVSSSTHVPAEVFRLFSELSFSRLQLGADETKGRGVVRVEVRANV